MLAAQPAPQQEPQKTFSADEYNTEKDAGFAAQEYCRSLWGAARGHGDWRKFHDAFVAGYKKAQPAPQQKPSSMEYPRTLHPALYDAADILGKMEKAQPVAQPVAWKFQEATYPEGDLRGRGWRFHQFSMSKPDRPWMQDDVIPLYAAPQAVNQMLLEAIECYEDALKLSYPEGAEGLVFDSWNDARAAIEKAEGDIYQSENCTCPGSCTGACNTGAKP
jgi:hypothetical protein